MISSSKKLTKVLENKSCDKLAIENTPNSQSSIQNGTHLGTIYDISLENALSNMKNKKIFFMKYSKTKVVLVSGMLQKLKN